VLLVLLVLALVPYFLGLGDSAIWDSNEAFYVETPREMREAGDFLNPSFNYQPRFNKPPLSYWIVAAFYAGLGESIEAERLAIALGALLLVGAAFGVGRAAFSTDAGVLAALALASAPRVVMFARRIFIDVYVTAFLGLVLLCFVLAECRPAHRRRYLALMYVAIGLAFMTKGPLAAVVPGLTILAYLLAYGRLADLRRLMLPTGALIVAAIVLPWYGAIYAEHGWVYIRRFFVEENLLRYTAPYGERVAERGPFFYVPVLLTDLFPWSLFAVAALGVHAWQGWRERREARRPDGTQRLPSLLVLWVVVIVGFFSLSQTKQDLYVFPAATALAALVGGLVARGVSGDTPWATWVRAVGMLVGVLFAVAGAGTLYLFSSPARVYAISGAPAVAVVAMIGGAGAAVLAARRRPAATIVTLAAAAIMVNWIFVLQALPSFRRYQPVPEMADRIRERAGAHARVGYYRMALPSLVYYLRRPVFEALEPDQMAEALSLGETYCLIRAADYEAVRDSLPGPTCVLARGPIFDVKVGNVIARTPLPELLLVSNKCE
jgi:4-amino-4-deoxy-L-arabinose transferase-like glycosyltransferase